MLLAGPQAALAACDVTGSATPSVTNSVSCAANTTTVVGTNTNGATASSNAYNQTFTANGDVSAGIGAGVTVSGEGLTIFQMVANGALTVTNDGAVTSLTDTGLQIYTGGGGLLTYSGNGNVTGTGFGNGLSADSLGGSISVNTGTGTITAFGFAALEAGTTGAGTISVTTSGTISSGGGGIRTLAADGLTTINVNGGSVTASGATGIEAISSGAGGVQINVNAGSVAGAGIGLHINSSGTGTIDVSIAAGATVSSGGYGLLVNGGTGATNITVLGTLSSANTAADFRGTLTVGNGGTSGTLAGDVSMQDSATLLRFNRSDAVSFGDVISGSGALEKLGAGTLTLSGTSTYTGATTVNAGTLVVNGSIAASSSLTMNSGTTLGGTGTVGNTSIGGGATFQPGSGTPGSSMNVNGMLGFNAAATYAVDINPTTASFANVSGAATLGGATVNAFFANGSYISKQYTILTAGSINGTFGSLVNFNLPANFHDTLSYDATHAYLNLILDFSTPAPGGLNGNQNAVANALINFFNTTGGIPMAFASLNANGLSQASGEAGAAVAQTGITGVGQFINAIFDGAFDDNNGQGATNFAEENAYAAKRKVSPQANEAYAAVTPRDRLTPSFASRWNVWASVYGGNSRVNGDATAGTSTTTGRIFGTAVGATYRFTPDTQAGLALGGAGSSFSLDGGFGGGKADVFNAAFYAKHTMGAAYVAGLLGYSWQDTTTDRTVTISGTDQLHASFKAQALAARLEGGWRYATPMIGITPYSALQTTTFYLPSYGETATSGSSTYALNYASKSVTATRSELGAKFDKAMSVQGGLFTLKARTAWAHDWNTDRAAIATFQTLPGATFTVNGAQPSANAALASLGAEMKWHNGWTLAASVDGEFSRTTAGYTGKGTVRYAW